MGREAPPGHLGSMENARPETWDILGRIWFCAPNTPFFVQFLEAGVSAYRTLGGAQGTGIRWLTKWGPRA